MLCISRVRLGVLVPTACLLMPFNIWFANKIVFTEWVRAAVLVRAESCSLAPAVSSSSALVTFTFSFSISIYSGREHSALIDTCKFYGPNKWKMLSQSPSRSSMSQPSVHCIVHAKMGSGFHAESRYILLRGWKLIQPLFSNQSNQPLAYSTFQGF